jgi:hypothetical protein
MREASYEALNIENSILNFFFTDVILWRKLASAAQEQIRRKWEKYRKFILSHFHPLKRIWNMFSLYTDKISFIKIDI